MHSTFKLFILGANSQKYYRFIRTHPTSYKYWQVLSPVFGILMFWIPTKSVNIEYTFTSIKMKRFLFVCLWFNDATITDFYQTFHNYGLHILIDSYTWLNMNNVQMFRHQTNASSSFFRFSGSWPVKNNSMNWLIFS